MELALGEEGVVSGVEARAVLMEVLGEDLAVNESQEQGVYVHMRLPRKGHALSKRSAISAMRGMTLNVLRCADPAPT